MYLKRKLYIVVNECSFELGIISFMRAGVIKIVRLDLYGPPCIQHNTLLKSIHFTSPRGLKVQYFPFLVYTHMLIRNSIVDLLGMGEDMIQIKFDKPLGNFRLVFICQ